MYISTSVGRYFMKAVHSNIESRAHENAAEWNYHPLFTKMSIKIEETRDWYQF